MEPEMTAPPTLIDRALEHHRAGRLAAAAALYEELLAAEPHHANALHLLGLIRQQEGNHARATEYFTRAIAADPAAAPFLLNRGRSLRAVGRVPEALADFTQARELDPGFAEAHHQEGNALKHLGRWAEAIASLRAATRLAPTHAVAWLNLGAAHFENHELADALQAFRRALELEPSRPEAHNILGHALAQAGDFSAAETAFQAALRLRPDYAAAHDNLGRLCKSQARHDDAHRHFRAALASTPSPTTHSNFLLALHFSDSISPDDISAEHRRWAELYAEPLTATSRPPAAVPPTPGRRLRVGYVSPDFINHAVARFIEPVLANHDRTHFEIFCYSHAAAPDAVTARLRSLVEHWRDTSGLDEAQSATLILGDRIDLLVDLAGHTAGNQLLVFARRPAPVQITWIGYPNTTGLSAIDFRLTDAVSDPAGETDRWHTEKLIRLPESFSCYLAPPESPPLNPLPAARLGHITFGSFNQFAKLTPAVIAVWAQLLRRAPAAHLLIRARSLADAATAARLKAAFARLEVDPERLELNGEELSIAAHQGFYHRVDIALDAFPYNGTTTTCEALWMGVPVITLAGRTHVARVGASLLTHLGAPEWIAGSPGDYVERALALAEDPTHLAALRAGLRARFQASPLGDAPRFTGHLEAVFTSLCSGRSDSR
jgi:predicted O-linked N-acetylglucosamine transferase (SPINDLY family)